MAEALIRGLIALCLLVAADYVAFWVIGLLGIVLPPIIETVVWIIVALVAILYLFRALKSSGVNWLP